MIEIGNSHFITIISTLTITFSATLTIALSFPFTIISTITPLTITHNHIPHHTLYYHSQSYSSPASLSLTIILIITFLAHSPLFLTHIHHHPSHDLDERPNHHHQCHLTVASSLLSPMYLPPKKVLPTPRERSGVHGNADMERNIINGIKINRTIRVINP